MPGSKGANQPGSQETMLCHKFIWLTFSYKKIFRQLTGETSCEWTKKLSQDKISSHKEIPSPSCIVRKNFVFPQSEITFIVTNSHYFECFWMHLSPLFAGTILAKMSESYEAKYFIPTCSSSAF